MVRRLLSLALVAACCWQAAPAAGRVAVKAGTLIDGAGGPPVRNVVILIEDGRITTVGAAVSIPRDTKVIDLSKATVMPGFIDAHTHLTGRYIGEGVNWEDALVRDLPQSDAIRGVRNARLTLEAGFTTVRNVGAHDFSDIALRDMIAQGVVAGPRILAAGHALGITGGHCDENGYRPGMFDPDIKHGIADSPDEARAAVRYQIKHGADVIKICATGGVLSEGDAVGVEQFTLEEMKAVVETARMAERKVAAHAHGTEGIKAAVRAGVSSIEHGSMLDDEAISLMKEHKTFLVPTLMAQEAVERQAKENILTGLRQQKALFIAPMGRESFRKAVRAGVRVALGTDAGVFAHGTNGHEFTLMVRYGMDPMKAIVAGTASGAELLGLSGEVGMVKQGLRADLVAVTGDPLADIKILESVSFVMRDGEVIKNLVN